MNLRPYQSGLLADAMLAFANGARRVLVVLPTGAGKTVLFARLAQNWGGSAAIVAHRRELIRQASQKLGDTIHGVIAPEYPALARRLQVGSVQTMARRLARLPAFSLLILDEAHHAVAGQWRALLDAQPDALVLGVTATPERLDGRGLGDVFDTLLIGPSVADLVADGFLAPSRTFAPPVDIDFRRLRMLAGDYNPAQLADAMDRPTITGDAVQHYGRHAPGQPAIAFCVSVAHAEHVATEFRAAGWRSAHVHGALPADERDRRIGGLATGDVQVLASCELISEGLDVPAVGAAILLRPTESLGLYLQMVGRGMRPAPGKTHLTILDHAGTRCATECRTPRANGVWTACRANNVKAASLPSGSAPPVTPRTLPRRAARPVGTNTLAPPTRCAVLRPLRAIWSRSRPIGRNYRRSPRR